MTQSSTAPEMADGSEASSLTEVTLRERTPANRCSALDALVDLLSRPQGATIEGIHAATGWPLRSIRSALAAALKARLPVSVASHMESRGRVYRITPEVES